MASITKLDPIRGGDDFHPKVRLFARRALQDNGANRHSKLDTQGWLVTMLSADFLSALLAIVIIDLVLAGDKAIVIALAARNVPRHLQKRAIFCGTVGAVIVRGSLTMVVVWLLGVPGLLLAGGAALVWIAYRLLIPEEDGAG